MAETCFCYWDSGSRGDYVSIDPEGTKRTENLHQTMEELYREFPTSNQETILRHRVRRIEAESEAASYKHKNEILEAKLKAKPDSRIPMAYNFAVFVISVSVLGTLAYFFRATPYAWIPLAGLTTYIVFWLAAQRIPRVRRFNIVFDPVRGGFNFGVSDSSDELAELQRQNLQMRAEVQNAKLANELKRLRGPSKQSKSKREVIDEEDEGPGLLAHQTNEEDGN